MITAVTTTPAATTPPAASTPDLPQYNEVGRPVGTAKRLPFTKTLELQYGTVLGQFDQLYSAKQAALELSAGTKPAVAISTFAQPIDGVVEHQPFVVYDVDYAIKTRPFNPMEHPRTLETGDYHEGMVASFGYSTKDQSWQPGAAQYIVDNGKISNIENLEER